MRLSRLFGRTLREAPAEADTASHRLLVRAGAIDQLGAGLYTLLPFGLRAQRKIEGAVRRELEGVGAQEVLMPVLQPVELWQATGRDVAYGPELYRLRDRRERGFVLAPTHEEVVTRLAATFARSHRQLPVTLFQIQTKMRDEPRPRAGLLRVREFTMMDAYSFDAGEAGMDASFEVLREAFHRLFAALGLPVVAVQADSGAIGGKESVEFVLPSPAGEDTIVRCTRPACGYAANLEKAEFRPAPGATPEAPGGDPGDGGGQHPRREDDRRPRGHAPGDRPLPDAQGRLLPGRPRPGSGGRRGGLVFVGIRGDLAVNETKLRRVLGTDDLRLATDAEVGAAGPGGGVGLPGGGERGAHRRRPLRARGRGPGGGGQPGGPAPAPRPVRAGLHGRHRGGHRHRPGGRPLPPLRGAPHAGEGDRAGAHLQAGGALQRGAGGALPRLRRGASSPCGWAATGSASGAPWRAAVEAGHDERGIVWPPALAPYSVHLVALGYDQPDLTPVADALYQELQEAGLSVLLDDRAESAGVKLNDADLLGLPLRVTLGPRGLRQGESSLAALAGHGGDARPSPWKAPGRASPLPRSGASPARRSAPPETGAATR